VLLFFVYEFFASSRGQFQIFGEKNAIVLSFHEHVFTWGEKNNSSIKILLNAIDSYFSHAEVLSLEDMEEATELKGSNFLLQKFSPHIARLKAEDAFFWLLEDVSEEEIKHLISQRIVLESDFWILVKGNGFLETGIVDIPQKGILYVGERVPSKKLREFAKNNEIPIVSVKETGGFYLTKDDEEWIVQVRK